MCPEFSLHAPQLKFVLSNWVCFYCRAGRYEVDGYVYNAAEEPKILMTGKWNESMSYQPCDMEGEPLPGTDLKEVHFINLFILSICLLIEYLLQYVIKIKKRKEHLLCQVPWSQKRECWTSMSWLLGLLWWSLYLVFQSAHVMTLISCLWSCKITLRIIHLGRSFNNLRLCSVMRTDLWLLVIWMLCNLLFLVSCISISVLNTHFWSCEVTHRVIDIVK